MADVPTPKVTLHEYGKDKDKSGIINVPICSKVTELSAIASVSEPDITGGNGY